MNSLLKGNCSKIIGVMNANTVELIHMNAHSMTCNELVFNS